MNSRIFFKIIIVIQVNFLAAYNLTDIFEHEKRIQCASYGSKCHPHSLQPCCEPKNVCKKQGWGARGTTYFCLYSGKLKESCQRNVDCSKIDNAECSVKKICECQDNYINVAGEMCAPLLGGFCIEDTDCVPTYSACISKKCTCQRGFLSQSTYRCIPTPLGLPCENTRDCYPREHIICSSDKVCSCRENHVMRNDATCAPLLEEYCWSDEICAPDHSICINNTCICEPNYYVVSNYKCILS